MIVDNDLFTAFAISSQISQGSYKCDIVGSGKDALKKIKKRFEEHHSTYKLIISNLFLTRLKGMKMIEALLKYFERK